MARLVELIGDRHINWLGCYMDAHVRILLVLDQVVV